MIDFEKQPGKNSPLEIPFPLEIFSPPIQENFRNLAKQHSIPVGYLATGAIFAISSLSGNMYTTELNGRIRNSLYALLVGDSGLGKSVPWEVLCSDVVAKRTAELKKQFDEEHRKWRILQETARKNKTPFEDPEPKRQIRLIQGGTLEGIMKYAEQTAAGFGIYYDEGKDMMGSPNAYKKSNDSLEFWNKIWNGGFVDDVRADSTRERFIFNASISVLAGMQTKRMPEYITQEAINSGLSARFLFCYSDIIPLNEEVDHFAQNLKACPEWRTIVLQLFNRGATDFFKDDQPTLIKFTERAKTAYNAISSELVRASNIARKFRKVGDISEIMGEYESKLYKYLGRFLILTAILDNHLNPVIDIIHVERAKKLYDYYRAQAEFIFKLIHGQQETGLNPNEQKLYDNLPATFTGAVAAHVCESLEFSKKYFLMVFKRKFSKGMIRNCGGSRYEKLLI